MESNQERFERIKVATMLSKEEQQWLIGLAEKADYYENLLSAIANIDTIFMNDDGSERTWNDKEALQTIDHIVQPIWVEVCERIRKENIRFRP